MKKLIFAAILMAGFAGIASAQSGENFDCENSRAEQVSREYWYTLCNRYGVCEFPSSRQSPQYFTGWNVNGTTCGNDLFARGGMGDDTDYTIEPDIWRDHYYEGPLPD